MQIVIHIISSKQSNLFCLKTYIMRERIFIFNLVNKGTNQIFLASMKNVLK